MIGGGKGVREGAAGGKLGTGEGSGRGRGEVQIGQVKESALACNGTVCFSGLVYSADFLRRAIDRTKKIGLPPSFPLFQASLPPFINPPFLSSFPL